MTVETQDLRQKAVVWAFTGAYTAAGEAKTGTPYEIACRWESTNSSGEQAQDDKAYMTATVHVAVYVPPKSTIRLGALADLPATLDNLCAVSDYNEVPDLKGRNFKRTLTVKRSL